MTAIFGILVSKPKSRASRKPFPNALVFPRFPPGTTIQSGVFQPRDSSNTNAAHFWPSIRYGLMLLTIATRSESKLRTISRARSKSPSMAATVAP